MAGGLHRTGVVALQHTPCSQLLALTQHCHSYDPAGEFFQGRIDDVRVYGRLLYPDEVNAAYKEGRPPGVRILEWVETK